MEADTTGFQVTLTQMYEGSDITVARAEPTGTPPPIHWAPYTWSVETPDTGFIRGAVWSGPADCGGVRACAIQRTAEGPLRVRVEIPGTPASDALELMP